MPFLSSVSGFNVAHRRMAHLYLQVLGPEGTVNLTTLFYPGGGNRHRGRRDGITPTSRKETCTKHLLVALLCGARHTWILVEVSWGFEGTGFKMGYDVFDFSLESVCRHVRVPAHLSSSGSLFPSACFIPLFSHTIFFLLRKHRVS